MYMLKVKGRSHRCTFNMMTQCIAGHAVACLLLHPLKACSRNLHSFASCLSRDYFSIYSISGLYNKVTQPRTCSLQL